MTGPADEHERTMAFAEIALGQIKALRQAATPRNYEVWYAYATGYHPSLNQKINAAAGSANSYTESLADMSEKLGNSKDREGLRAIVEGLVQTAKEMEVSNQKLEQRLHASKQEIDTPQENLEAVRTESLTD